MATAGTIELNITSNPAFTWTSQPGGTSVFIDPKTLKKCKHRWEPRINMRDDQDCWTIRPECRRCGITGSPSDKGVNLRKLIKRLG